MHTVNAPIERTWSIVLKNVIYAHSIPYNSSDKIVYILMYYIIMKYGNVINEDTHIWVILRYIQSYDNKVHWEYIMNFYHNINR